MINHTVMYKAATYNNLGASVSVIEQCDIASSYEHKTRKGLLHFAINKAFWDAYNKGLVFCYMITVDGNAV